MKKTKKIAAAVLAMTMAAGLAVTGCSGKGEEVRTQTRRPQSSLRKQPEAPASPRMSAACC